MRLPWTNTGAMTHRVMSASGERKKASLGKIQSSLLVEYSGLEPLTSTLPVSRSSQMS